MMDFLLLNFYIHAFKIVPQKGREQNKKPKKKRKNPQATSKWFGLSALQLFSISVYKVSYVPMFPTSAQLYLVLQKQTRLSYAPLT